MNYWLLRPAAPRFFAKPTHARVCRCSLGPPRASWTRQTSYGHTLVASRQRPILFSKPNVSSELRGFKVVGTLGLGLSAGVVAAHLAQRQLLLEPSPPAASAPAATAAPTNPYDPDQPLRAPKGLANPYELTFGTVCGVCAGVFIKKGLKAAAFILGGVFVLLQYFDSLSWLNVDWSSAESRFKQTFYTHNVNGEAQPPTIQSFFRWIVNFVMADFQPRASFLAGLILGLRLG